MEAPYTKKEVNDKLKKNKHLAPGIPERRKGSRPVQWDKANKETGSLVDQSASVPVHLKILEMIRAGERYQIEKMRQYYDSTYNENIEKDMDVPRSYKLYTEQTEVKREIDKVKSRIAEKIAQKESAVDQKTILNPEQEKSSPAPEPPKKDDKEDKPKVEPSTD